MVDWLFSDPIDLSINLLIARVVGESICLSFSTIT